LRLIKKSVRLPRGPKRGRPKRHDVGETQTSTGTSRRGALVDKKESGGRGDIPSGSWRGTAARDKGRSGKKTSRRVGSHNSEKGKHVDEKNKR